MVKVNTDEKVNFLVATNVLLILFLMLSNMGFLLPGDAQNIISTSERDLKLMTGMYNRLAESHNNVNSYQLPLFNESLIPESQVDAYYLLGQRDLKTLAAYKNEGTLRFDIAYYDAAGSNSTIKVANTYLVLWDVAMREKALQNAARDKIEEPKQFLLAVLGISILGFVLIMASVYLRRLQKKF